MFIVIYEKATKKIVRVLEETSKIVSYGYSDNCAEKHMEEKPEGQYLK